MGRMVACLSCTPETLCCIRTPRCGSNEALIFLQKCSNFKQLKQIHGKMIRFGISNDQLLIRKLVHLCSSYGQMDYATLVFHQLNAPDTFTWNVMIREFTICGSPEQALILFEVMLCYGFPPDKFTFPFVINACRAYSALDFGKMTHALAIKSGLSSDIYVQNTLMGLYFKSEDSESGCKVFDKMPVRNVVSWTTMIAGFVTCGKLDAARRIFEQMPSKNVVSWTAMIDGYVKDQQPVEVFKLFQRMQLDNVRPNEFTVVSLIRACTEMGSLKLGKWIHDFAVKNGFEIGPFLGTALIDMYSKCGSLDDARKVFDKMPIKTLATWNAMITSLGVHGMGKEALALLEEMKKANIFPDAITFVGVFSACCQMNNLKEALKYFNLMTEHYGITPISDHYTCLIELYNGVTRWDESVEPNYNMISELLPRNKVIGIADIKEIIQRHHGDSGCLSV